MNYIKIYEDLIDKGLERKTVLDYYEKHHIIPRCMGGSNDQNNLVKLTPEEHYVAHQILVKIYPGNTKLVQAAMMMCRGRNNNKIYGWLRRKFSTNQSTKMKLSGPTFNKRWISNETETILVDKHTAEYKIFTNEYIAGKKAVIAHCGHLVKDICKSCIDAKGKSYILKKEKTKELAMDLFNEFKNSNCKSVGEFAIVKNTSQPRLSALWKRYVPEYRDNRRPGKSFLVRP